MFTEKKAEQKIKKILNRSNEKCLVDGCTEKSIYSHIISKSISINKISKDNHLVFFSPTRHGYAKIPKFILVGINNNPAFNGFCKNHDGMFALIDNSEITNFFGVYLQIYRTISSEAYYFKMGDVIYSDIDENSDFILKQIYNDLNENRNEKIEHEDLKKIEEWFKKDSINKNESKNKRLINEKRHIEKFKKYFLNTIEKSKSKLINTEITKNTLLVEHIETNDLNCNVFLYLTDFQIPVAISTLHILPKSTGIDDNFYSFYIVVPYEKSSIIIGVIEDAACSFHKKICDTVNTSFVDGDRLSILNFIESLVISSPENSFLSPIVTQSMNADKLKVFERDCMCIPAFLNDSTYLSEYDMSIFDDVRRQIIEEGSVNKNKIDIENAKLLNVPIRNDYDVQIQKIQDKIIAESLEKYKID